MSIILNVPQLRFSEFSGEWEEKKYGDIYSFYTTNSFSRDNLNYESGEVKNIHYGDIHTKFSTMFRLEDEHVPFVNIELNLSKIKEESYCQDGDLVIADASEDYADIGKTIELIDLNNQKILAGLHTFLARPNKYNMALGYTGYLLQSWKVRWQVMRESQGTKVLSLSTKRLSNVILTIPSKQEQEKIASFLSSVDTKIEQLTSKVKLLQEYKKGVMQKIFSQEIRFQVDDGNDYPEWVEKKLGEQCINISSGKTKAVENGEYNVYGSTGIIGKTDAFTHSGNYILVARVGANAGFINYVIGKFSVTDNTLIIDLNKDKVIPQFLMPLLYKYNLNRLVFGSGQPLITGGQLKSLKLSFPSIEEQTKIANFLSSIDSKIEQAQKELNSTKEFKKALLQQMFV